MTQTDTINAILALTLAEEGYWNDCWHRLSLGPRPLFERVEGYCAKPRRQHPYYQAKVIKTWLAENGITIPPLGPEPKWTHEL